MDVTTLAAAQCAVKAGDINANLAKHLRLMEHARAAGVELLIFPELSLTGYEPTLAQALAQDMDCAVLDPLRRFAQEATMTTVVGLPLRHSGHGNPLIAAFILHHDGALGVYTKQHLHPGEDDWFSPGSGGEMLHLAQLPIALSVCADFSHEQHPANAAACGAKVYAASVLISTTGYPHDSALLQSYAARHRMAVLMANHGGPTGGYAAAGRSAFWDEQGRCVAATRGKGDSLLIVKKELHGWEGFEIPVPH